MKSLPKPDRTYSLVVNFAQLQWAVVRVMNMFEDQSYNNIQTCSVGWDPMSTGIQVLLESCVQ